MLPLIGAAAIGAGGSVIGGALGALGQSSANRTNIRLQREQNAWNERQAEKANKWNIEQWERENLYNSPMQQMQRLEQAGLNPNLMYSQGNPGSASSLKSEMPSSVAPARVSNSLQFLGNSLVPAISMYQDLQNRQAQLTVQQKQAALLDQEIAGKALDNISKDYMNNVSYSKSKYAQAHADYDYMLKQIKFDSAAIDQHVKRLNRDILEKTSPALIDKATWITRDVKQRALRGELDYDFQRELKAFGMTPQDDLWQRKLVPIVEKFLIQAITRDNARSLRDFYKTHDIYNRTIKK